METSQRSSTVQFGSALLLRMSDQVAASKCQDDGRAAQFHECSGKQICRAKLERAAVCAVASVSDAVAVPGLFVEIRSISIKDSQGQVVTWLCEVAVGGCIHLKVGGRSADASSRHKINDRDTLTPTRSAGLAHGVAGSQPGLAGDQPTKAARPSHLRAANMTRKVGCAGALCAECWRCSRTYPRLFHLHHSNKILSPTTGEKQTRANSRFRH